MIKVTPQAATILTAARDDAGAPSEYGVRFFAERKEGEAPRLAIGFAEQPGPGDEVAEQVGLKTFVAPEVSQALGEATIDARVTDGQQELVVVRGEA